MRAASRGAAPRQAIAALAAAALCAIPALWCPPQALAVYSAAYHAQSNYPDPLEVGDTTELWFEFRNTGDQTWFRDGAVPVRLGTSNPYGSPNPFFDPDDWLQSNRPTALDQESVPPNGIGRFTFRVKAPTALMTNQQYAFAPLAEFVVWMIPDGMQVWMPFTVIPAQAPTLRITGAPARVKRGDAFTVSAEATDNRRIDKLRFGVGSVSQELTEPTTAPSLYSATLSSAGLGEGTQTVVVRATDPGGREAVATTSFEVYAPPAAPPAPAPTSPTVKPLSQFTAVFATVRRRGRGTDPLGKLLSLAGLTGVPRSSQLSVSCVRGCRSRLRKSFRWRSRPVTLPLTLLRRTVVQIRVTTPEGARRTQRYRFVSTRTGVTARRISG